MRSRRMDAGDSGARVTTYDATPRDGSVAAHERFIMRRHRRSTAPERMPRGRAVFLLDSLRSATGYWQVVVKLSGSATTVTPRIVAPTSTNWPFGRVVARTGPMIGSRIGIDAILR